jgi:tetratricopeptide (TPR) repeat protein
MSMARRRAVLLGALACAVAGCAVRVPPNAAESEQMRQAAVLAYESGEAARAETLYQGLARAYPADPENWFRLGNLYARANRTEDAATAYQKALQLNPNDARAWYNLGIVREHQAYTLFLQANVLVDKADPMSPLIAERLQKLEPPPAAPNGTPAPASSAKPPAPPARAAAPATPSSTPAPDAAKPGK